MDASTVIVSFPRRVGERLRRSGLLRLCWLHLPCSRRTPRLSGLISDPSGLAVAGARVVVQSADTGATRTVSSNQQGEYSVPALLPGPYNITVEANGFKTVHQNGVVVEVDQRARLDFALTIGSNTETITVEGSAPLLNTSDASVSTVDRQPVRGKPALERAELQLPHRSDAGSGADAGQFLRAGPVQREWPAAGCKLLPGGWSERQPGNAVRPILGQGGAGQLPATSAFGGTSNLVSLDALEEFRIQTSTFAPEYGRTPGAQISVVTKSGTNTFHGTAFEYFRNDKLDANDWFANAQRSGEARTAAERFRRRAGRADHERQAVLLRLLRGAEGAPASCCGYVRAVAGLAPERARSRPAAAQRLPPAERAGPRQRNGRIFGELLRSLHAEFFRHPDRLSAMAKSDYFRKVQRRSIEPRSARRRRVHRPIATLQDTKYRTQSLTLGSNQALTPRLTNEFRFNYSRSRANSFYTLDNFGGAVPPPELGAVSIGRFSAELQFCFLRRL